MLIPKKLIFYLYCKNKGFRVASYLKSEYAIFRLHKAYFFKKLLNIDTRTNRLSTILNVWKISDLGDYNDDILVERRDILESIEDALSCLVNHILKSEGLF